ncbi:MAG: ATP-binding cassette domain-containing protein [Weeksellaceae bacterium]|nr:ATP-binding cassette domain-containing protein [Weeksellaceae bacterium]
MENLLVAEGVSKYFGKKVALQDFSISIPRGSIYGLLGPNGAGKTTFIRTINQITVPDTGRIIFDGEPLAQKHISRIGYMPEERGLYKSMKVGDQALYLAQLKGLSKQDAVQKLKFWFDKLDIGDWWNKKLSELSKGMGQKIQFIVTVLHEPDLLIFDEPFSGFDPLNANLIRDEILELKRKGATIIFSTHRMESVEELCDYVALINNARKVLDGEMWDVRNRYKQGAFQVNLRGSAPEAIERLAEMHRIDGVSTDQSGTSFRIYSDGLRNNELLHDLSQIGHIQSFTEVIPSMNEVFLNAVKGS